MKSVMSPFWFRDAVAAHNAEMQAQDRTDNLADRDVFAARLAFHETLHRFGILHILEHRPYPGDGGPLDANVNLIGSDEENNLRPGQLDWVRRQIRPR